MTTIKYLGHPVLGHVYRTGNYKVKEGRTVRVSDEEAKRLLRQFPGTFQLVGVPKRMVEKPESHRMRISPKHKRGVK